MTTDHGESQSASAPAPAQTVSERLSSFAQGLIQDSEREDPNAWAQGQQEEPPEGEVPPEQPPTEEAEPPATPPEEMEEVEYGEGKKYQIPTELKRGWLREDDYTRKTQKLADRNRQVDAQLQTLGQQASALRELAPYVGQLQSIDAQLQELRSQMSPQLMQTDPVAFGALGAQFNLLQDRRGQLAQFVGQAEQTFTQGLQRQQQQVAHARLEAEMPLLEAVIKDFNPEKHGKEVSDYLKKSGIAQEALGFINTSPAAIALVVKAQRYDQLQSDKKIAEKKVQNLPPTAKPGQRVSPAEGDTDLKKLRELNRKTGGRDADIRRELIRAHLNRK